MGQLWGRVRGDSCGGRVEMGQL